MIFSAKRGIVYMKSIANHKLAAVFLVLLPLVFLTHGCQSLETVRSFSKSTVATAESYGKMISDLPASCQRRVMTEIQIMNFEFVGPDTTDIITNHLETCELVSESLEGINDANGVLAGYGEALGKLAAKDVVDFSAELDAIKDNLNNVEWSRGEKTFKPFDKPKINATFSIARFLFDISLKAYQYKLIVETIEEGQDNIEPLIGGLDEVLNGYNDMLTLEKGEQERLLGRYKVLKLTIPDTSQEFRKIKTNICAFAIDNFSEEELIKICGDQRLFAIDNRERIFNSEEGRRIKRRLRTKSIKEVLFEEQIRMVNANKQYVEVESKIAEISSNITSNQRRIKSISAARESLKEVVVAHNDLYNNRNTIDSEDLIMAVKKYSRQVSELVKEVKAAYAPQERE